MFGPFLIVRSGLGQMFFRRGHAHIFRIGPVARRAVMGGTFITTRPTATAPELAILLAGLVLVVAFVERAMSDDDGVILTDEA